MLINPETGDCYRDEEIAVAKEGPGMWTIHFAFLDLTGEGRRHGDLTIQNFPNLKEELSKRGFVKLPDELLRDTMVSIWLNPRHVHAIIHGKVGISMYLPSEVINVHPKALADSFLKENLRKIVDPPRW